MLSCRVSALDIHWSSAPMCTKYLYLYLQGLMYLRHTELHSVRSRSSAPMCTNVHHCTNVQWYAAMWTNDVYHCAPCWAYECSRYNCLSVHQSRSHHLIVFVLAWPCICICKVLCICIWATLGSRVGWYWWSSAPMHSQAPQPMTNQCRAGWCHPPNAKSWDTFLQSLILCIVVQNLCENEWLLHCVFTVCVCLIHFQKYFFEPLDPT